MIPGARGGGLAGNALAVVVASAPLVLVAWPAPGIIFTVTGATVCCPGCCLFFRKGKRRVRPCLGRARFAFLLIFVRATRGALRRSTLFGSGDGFPWFRVGGVGSSYVSSGASGTSLWVSSGVSLWESLWESSGASLWASSGVSL